MNLFDVYPLFDINIVKGKGCHVWDENGTEYLDLYGGHAVISIGHAHPHYIEMISSQVAKLGFYSNSVINKLQQEVAARLGKISGYDDYSLFLINSGAEANENALKLEAAGMIDKAGRLFAQVNMDEAQRSLEASQKETAVLQNALRTLLNITDTCSIQPVSPLFINAVLPAKEEFLQTMQTENYTVNQLQLQSHIAKQQLRIEQSGYLPDIAVFGKQTLYAHGIQSNLVPRTMIGVGFTWNLFDGLAREKRIRQSKIAQQTLSIGQEKAKDDLSVGIDKLYTQMQKAQDNVRALNTTIELSEELVRICKKSFTEGMATSTEVIDSETMLATVRVARLAAYYEYDVALMNLLALCGTPEEFGKLSNLRVEN